MTKRAIRIRFHRLSTFDCTFIQKNVQSSEGNSLFIGVKLYFSELNIVYKTFYLRTKNLKGFFECEK